MREQGYKPSTLSNRYRSLQSFWKWQLEEGEVKESPMQLMTLSVVPELAVPVISAEDLKRLVRVCDGTDFVSRRDKSVIMVLLDTGMRRSELAGIKWRTSTGITRLSTWRAKDASEGPAPSGRRRQEISAAT